MSPGTQSRPGRETEAAEDRWAATVPTIVPLTGCPRGCLGFHEEPCEPRKPVEVRTCACSTYGIDQLRRGHGCPAHAIKGAAA